MPAKMKRNEASSSGSSNRGETVVSDCGRRKSSCGYCKSTSPTSIAHGLWANSITVDDYQDLLDRGWRRSGRFLYKPEMEKTCCPSYTIRLKASDFVPTKEQLRVYRRMQRFLDGEPEEKRDNSKDACTCVCHDISSLQAKGSLSGKDEDKTELIICSLSDVVDSAVHKCIESGEFPSNDQLPKASIKKVSQAKRKILVQQAGELIYTCNIAFQIAATLRRTKSIENYARHEANMSPKAIAEKLVACLSKLSKANDLELRACDGHINYYAATTQGSISDDMQIVSSSDKSAAICKRKDCCAKRSSDHPQGKMQKLDFRFKRSNFDVEEFALYRRYQMKVHNDKPEKVTKDSYMRFLVDTPLVYVPPTGDGSVPPCGFGSFHQQYWIDGRLIAVGVIDILPKCLSSKYLFWDPDFSCLSLGKYSALQEIDWVKENQVHCSTLQYYYLGYYIHSCSKMRYKAAYRPSELLCPLRYKWVPFDVARPLLDRNPYVVLSEFSIVQNGQSSPTAVAQNALEFQHVDDGKEASNDVPMDVSGEMVEPEDESSDDESGPETSDQTSLQIEKENLDDLLIGLRGNRVRYKDVRRDFRPRHRSYLEDQLHIYMKVVGKNLAERMEREFDGVAAASQCQKQKEAAADFQLPLSCNS